MRLAASHCELQESAEIPESERAIRRPARRIFSLRNLLASKAPFGCLPQRFVNCVTLTSRLESYYISQTWYRLAAGNNQTVVIGDTEPARRFSARYCLSAGFCTIYFSPRLSMYRSNKRLDIRLRLSEINRRFAELNAVSSKLAGMAAQLGRLRKVSEGIGRFTDRSSPLSRRRNDDYPPKERLGDGRRNSRTHILDNH